MKRLIAIVATLAALSGCATFPHPPLLGQGHTGGATSIPSFWMDASGSIHEGAVPPLARFRSALRVGIRYGQPSSAISLVNCAVNTPCTSSGPVNTGTGDPAYLAFGKYNSDWLQIENMFGATGLLVGNGDIPNALTSATYSNVVVLWSGCASGTPILSYTGSCVAGGAGGSSDFSALLSGTNAEISAPTQGTPTTATTGGSLPASTTYYFVVTATNGNGQTTISAVESVTTGSGTATNTVTPTWTAVTGATGYTVWISTSTITSGEASVAYTTASSSATSVTIGSVPATTATTPSANTTGAAMLVGTGSSLGVTGSGTIAASTAAALATNPTTCSATQAATGILANGNATGCFTPSGSGTVTDGSGTTTANELLLSSTTAHAYTNATTLPTAAMPAMSGDCTSSAGSTSLTCSKVNGASFPASASCISSNSSAQPVAGCPQALNVEPLAPPVQSAATTSTTGGTLAAATYYYVIEATNASGNSSISNEENVTTTGTTSSNTITWAAVTGATGYTVYRGASAGGENVYYSPGNVTTYTDTNATSTSGSPPGAAYTIQSTDAGKLLLFSNATPVAVTLPQATGSFASGFAFNAQNKGAGLVTITPTTSTINGAASLAIPDNMGCSGASDGTNYQVASCTALLSNWLNAASSGTSVTPICQPGLQRTVTTVTATGNFTINAPTGCTEGQQVLLKITYTASDTYTWNAAFHANAANPGALPTATGGTSGVDMFIFYDDAANSRFDYLAEAPAF